MVRVGVPKVGRRIRVGTGPRNALRNRPYVVHIQPGQLHIYPRPCLYKHVYNETTYPWPTPALSSRPADPNIVPQHAGPPNPPRRGHLDQYPSLNVTNAPQAWRKNPNTSRR